MEWTVWRISQPWVVVGVDCRIYQFATRREAAAFAKAERAERNEGMRAFLRRQAEEEEEIFRWNRERSGDA
jgi:hypothetical protein